MYLCSIRKTQPLISWIICLDVRLLTANQRYCTCDRETLSAGLNINGKYKITNLKAFLETISDGCSSKCFFQCESQHNGAKTWAYTYFLSTDIIVQDLQKSKFIHIWKKVLNTTPPSTYSSTFHDPINEYSLKSCHFLILFYLK